MSILLQMRKSVIPRKILPTSSEKNNCQVHNSEELSRLKNLKVIVTLGEVAYKQAKSNYMILI